MIDYFLADHDSCLSTADCAADTTFEGAGALWKRTLMITR